MPKFSVIVPVYNMESYIRDCLDSIIAQTFEDYEVILVDDGSTDKSSKICDEYAQVHDRMRVIHKANGGLVSARQAGAREARGAYCVALDSDDWVKPSYLSDFAKVIDEYNPDVVCSGIELIDDNRIDRMIPFLEEGYYDRQQIERQIFPRLIQNSKAESFEPNICSKAIRTELYKLCQLSVDTRIKNGEDSSCTIPCFYHSKSVYILKKCGYCYRYNRASMTKGLKPMPWNQQILVSEQILRTVDISKYDFKEQIDRRICHGLFNICVSQFYSERRYGLVRNDILSHLEENKYQGAINNAVFSSAKAKFMLVSLKYKLTFLMFLYAKVKRR